MKIWITFRDKIRMITRVIQKDTTIKGNFIENSRSDLERYVWAEIESYSIMRLLLLTVIMVLFFSLQVHLLLF